MVNIKPITLFIHLAIVELYPIISDQDLWNLKYVNDVLPQTGNDLLGGHIC
jgi:hypothetical protein